MNEVESKIAIVTGAIRGIGKATSSRFKREGITVIETDILPDQDRNDTYEESQSDFKNQFLVHDVTEEKSWKEDNTMAKSKRATGQTLVYKIIHRKTKNEQQEPH